MAFVQNAGAGITIGIIGGLVLLSTAYLWYKYGIFSLKFLNPEGNIEAEDMVEYTAIRAEVGQSNFKIKLRPRIGLDISEIGFAFFDKGKLPWLVGKRRVSKEAVVYDVNHPSIGALTIDDEGSYVNVGIPLTGGSDTYIDLFVRISNKLNPWEGVLSFQIHYKRGGNPVKRNVRTKFIVNEIRPVRSIGKKILKAKCIPQALGKEGSQN
jgi:hypothetical protein